MSKIILRRGRPGWFYPWVRQFDPADVSHITFNRRLFRVFDRDLDYKMKIHYWFCRYQLTSSTVSRRYGSIPEMKKDAESIIYKIDL